MKRIHLASLLLGISIPILMGVAITFASAVVPIAAATDATSICYNRDRQTSAWSVCGVVSPVLDPTVVSGFANISPSTLCTPITTPSGAVLTDLKAKFKLLVQLVPGACGTAACPSAD